MTRVRFAPSPTGSLHLGSALSAVGNRRFADEHGGSFLLRIDETDPEGALRFGQLTLLRADGTPTYQLASAVDDADFEITHVIRGSDHRANAELQSALISALGATPPEYIHHGLLLGEDGTKLSKR